MAHTLRQCSLALTFITMWLLIKAKIDVCKKGNVTVEPSYYISYGSAVNISCSLKPKQGCQHRSSLNRLVLYEFNKIVGFHHGSSFTSQVTNLPLGSTLFICKLDCVKSNEILCGAEISVGVVPGQPQNISCAQKGKRGTVACSWDQGQESYLYTKYTLQLNGPKNLTWQKQCQDDSCYKKYLDLGVSLPPELLKSSFTANVTATNQLGSSSSSSVFTFLDIVRPLPPWDIRIKFLNASVSRGTLQWRDEEWVLLNRLRYRPSNSPSWNMVNITNATGRYDLLDLKPFTEYEFQISSRLHLYKGGWSDWSESLRTQTPEEEPTGTLDIWYLKQHIDNEKQQIALFWKNLSVSEARGKILHYQVTLQEVTGRKTTLQNITAHTSWTCVVPRTGTWTVAVSATNSKGSSPPTRVNIMDLCGTGLLAPGQVSANSEGMDSIVVSWQPPGKAGPTVEQYVVEWRVLHPRGSTQPPLNWLRIPPYNASARISENIRPYICYEIRVHALSRDRGGCGSILGNSMHKAPLSGPHISAIMEEKGSVLISWNHIPVQEQMGCILHYRIYWKERDSDSQPRLCEIPYRHSQNSHPINSLQPRVTYILWMTALTASGESPQGKEREFCPQGKANWKAFVAPSICIAITMVGIFSIRYFRQKVLVLLVALRPQWYRKKIPDPANSTWAKKYPIMEEKTQLQLDRLQMAWPALEEPEPLVINEVLQQVSPVFRHPHFSNWPERGRGSQGHFTSEEDTVYRASSPQPSRPHTANLYKVLRSRGPDSQLGKTTGPLTVLPGDYLPSHEGYLPSNVDDLLPQEAPLTDPVEELEPQHISFSIFTSSSLHPLAFSCSEKLTLDQLKMRCDTFMLSGDA